MSATTIKTVVNNVDKIIGAVSGEQLERAAMAGAQVIEAQAKINVNRVFSSKSTGGAGLAGSIQSVVSEKSDTSVWVDVGPTVIYGRIQELGGIVRPVFAKALSWVDDSGVRIFAKMVQIPPRPYLRPAIDENKSKIERAVEYQLKKQISEAASE